LGDSSAHSDDSHDEHSGSTRRTCRAHDDIL